MTDYNNGNENDIIDFGFSEPANNTPIQNQNIQNNQTYKSNSVNTMKPKKVKKPKKKKKHIFLKLLILDLLIIAVFKISNTMAEKELNTFVSNYPFSFEGQYDNLGYVTEDFKVISTYDDKFNVKWTSDNSIITFDSEGNAKVIRPETSEKVVITQTYKKLLGKASIDYELNVIGTNSLTASNIDIVSLSELEDGSYNRDMKAVLSSDGSLQCMYGDFKGTKVYSKEDALAVIEAYKEQFGVNNNITFKVSNILVSEDKTNFQFTAYLDNTVIDNSSAMVIVENSGNRLSRISMCVDNININFADTNKLSEEELVTKVENYINNRKINLSPVVEVEEYSIDDYFIKELETTIDKHGYIHNYLLLDNLGNTYLIKEQDSCIIDIIEQYNSSEFKEIYKDVKATGYNEKSDKIEFDASQGITRNTNIVLYDRKRNIHTYKSVGGYDISKLGSEMLSSDSDIEQFGGIFVGLLGIGEQALLTNITSEIEDEDGEYEPNDAIETQAFKNMQDAYDFFYKYGFKSYDSKGALIKVLTRNELLVDNAAWHSLLNVMVINNSKDWVYSTGLYKEILTHEYSHAIFNQYINGSNAEVQGLNESFSDIFGLLNTPEADWEIGSNYYARDYHYTGGEKKGQVALKKGDNFIIRNPKVINCDKNVLLHKYPEKYKDDIWYQWGEEEHAISVIMTNVAYNLHVSEYFDDDTIAKIFINTLCNGFDKNTTYVTCRRTLIDEADKLWCSDEAIDFMATCFDNVGIYDESYEFRILPNEGITEETSDETTIIETKSSAIEGDSILDDKTSRRYLLIYSVADIQLGDATIILYEEKIKGNKYPSEKEMSTKIAELFNTSYKDVNIYGKPIKVEYKLADSKTFDFMQKYSKNIGDNMLELVFGLIGMMGLEIDTETKETCEDVLGQFMPYVFNWKVYDMTPYNFYDTLGLIE